jgi:RNA polymerase sigma factor (sigma-70 family)
MAIGKRGAVQRDLRTLFNVGTLGDLTDGQILERFATGHPDVAELAVAALIERHGPMVLGVCRGVLADPHDAEDAFQATFLVLLKKAQGLWVRDSLGPWLYQVAHRTASCARSAAVRRRKLERRAAEMMLATSVDHGAGIDRETGRVLHEEIDKLPDRYRVPIVLCDLEGRTCEEAARSMGCPVGTLKCWRARGRERLRSRLVRRGIGPSDTLLEFGLPAVSVPRGLMDSTVKSALQFAQGGGAAGINSAAVGDLTRGVLNTMFLARLRVIFSIAAPLVGILAVGVVMGIANHTGAAADHPPTQAGQVPPPKPAGKPIRQVLREAAVAVQTSSDPGPRAYGLIEIVKAQTRAGDREGALESARQAAAAALALDPNGQCWALAALAWARAGAGDREGALNVLRLARKRAEGIETDWGRVVVLRIIAGSQFDLDGRDDAMATIQSIRDIALAIPARDNSRLGPLGDLVGAQVYAGDFEGAFRTVETAAVGNHYLQGYLFGAMARAAAAEATFSLQPPKSLGPEDRKTRRSLLERIAKAIEPFAFAEEKPYVELAIASAMLGDFEGALRAAHRFGKGPIKYAHMIDQAATPYVLAVIGGYQGKAGQHDEARETLREALDLIRHDPRLSLRLGQVAWGQAKAGDIAGAMKTLESVDPRERLRLLIETAEQQDEAGDYEGARVTLRLALGEAERLLRAPAPRRGADLKVPPIMVNADGKVVPSDAPDLALDVKDTCLAEIAAIQAKLGALDLAVEAYRSITLGNHKGYAARDVAEARTKAGDAEGALAWALSLEAPDVRAWALRGLAKGVQSRR